MKFIQIGNTYINIKHIVYIEPYSLDSENIMSIKTVDGSVFKIDIEKNEKILEIISSLAKKLESIT